VCNSLAGRCMLIRQKISAGLSQNVEGYRSIIYLNGYGGTVAFFVI